MVGYKNINSGNKINWKEKIKIKKRTLQSLKVNEHTQSVTNYGCLNGQRPFECVRLLLQPLKNLCDWDKMYYYDGCLWGMAKMPYYIGIGK